MSATNLTAVRLTNWNTNPIVVPGAKIRTVQSLINSLRTLLAGPPQAVTMGVGYDQAAASGTLTLTAVTTSCTATVNGVETADCLGASDNVTATNLVTAINESTNPLISKQVTAARTLTAATGSFTLNAATGALTVAVGGTNINFTAVADNAVDSRTLAAAINANGTVSAKVTAVSDGVDKVNLTAVQNDTYGGRLGNAITLTGATGVTRSGSTLSGGLTKVTVTSAIPGFAGNAVTLAGTAGGGTITASGARLTGGTETQETLTFP